MLGGVGGHDFPRHDRAMPLKAPLLAAGSFYSVKEAYIMTLYPVKMDCFTAQHHETLRAEVQRFAEDDI